MKTHFWESLWMIFIILVLVYLLSGCAIFQKKPIPIPPKTGSELLVDTIQKSNIPIWVCIFIISGGAVALFNGTIKLGFSCIIFGSTSLALGLATSRFGVWIAVCGLVGTIATIIYSIAVKTMALKEIIKGIEVFKNKFSNPANIVDTAKAVGYAQDSTQVTSTTKKIVQKVKADLKVKGEI